MAPIQFGYRLCSPSNEEIDEILGSIKLLPPLVECLDPWHPLAECMDPLVSVAYSLHFSFSLSKGPFLTRSVLLCMNFFLSCCFCFLATGGSSLESVSSILDKSKLRDSR